MQIDITSYISPNYGPRPENTIIDTVVIHFTEMQNSKAALIRLTEPKFQVSCHYLICKTGKIYSLVDCKYRAWHAGQSCWRGKKNVNDYSIGIELDNNGNENFSGEQIFSLVKLLDYLKQIYPIKERNIIGHSDIVPNNKFDPGRFFPWEALARASHGIWFTEKLPRTKLPNLSELTIMLINFGYDLEEAAILNPKIIAAMRAFNEKFNPNCKDLWNMKSQNILEYFIQRFVS